MFKEERYTDNAGASIGNQKHLPTVLFSLAKSPPCRTVRWAPTLRTLSRSIQLSQHRQFFSDHTERANPL